MKLFAYLGALALACVVVMLAAVSVEAQTLSDSLLGVFRPYLIELAGIFVGALAAWLFKLVREKLGLDIEARHREAFQIALTQAAGMLIQRLGSGGMAIRLPVDSPGIADGVPYVQQAVPDAVARFRLNPDEIAEKLTAKIGFVAAAATAR
ncbi:hypothetical protein [Bosea rubneri]|uniref:Uncharacterized protein n=1 Tax=Bosea rubneri TaxID=3075434 RepID=A0ABU3S980_9HYPH|nr:hypothetical protein [Bosea sp. ZW T0_25]MDU0341343.1 hypothetical protein [Bosea sp. ZW T0_25]